MAVPENHLQEVMLHYGKNHFSQQKQIKILLLILKDAKEKSKQNATAYQLIERYQIKLAKIQGLPNAIKCINKCLIKLEALDAKDILSYIKQQGLYRILYHRPKLLGKDLPENDILRRLLNNGLIGIGIAALCIVFFALTAYFAAPFWLAAIASGLFIGASTYLSGLLYGIVNDIFATHANLPYFLLGHQSDQTSLLRTNNKIAQGIAWGIAATFGPVLIATVLFTIAATITAFFVPMAMFVMPILMAAMPLIAVGAEFYARRKTRYYLEHPDEVRFVGSNEYQEEGLSYMSPTIKEHAAWYANSDRNLFGFTKVPIIGLVGLVSLIVLSSVSVFLPPALIVAPLLAYIIPVAVSSLSSLILAAAGAYMHFHRAKQADDRYKLEFELKEIDHNLYLDEDLEYVNELLQKDENNFVNTKSNDASLEVQQYKPLFTSQEPEINSYKDDNTRQSFIP
ncbi:hypothetical protein [Legionella gresilensis]|uniref:hypothetical protein n=1 Tax=Legionella gresilensis TaxID=91823 RepID=UPI00104135D3|nr:hypothetical protein [Legionella gresilensis]